jgi:hypothetical protein
MNSFPHTSGGILLNKEAKREVFVLFFWTGPIGLGIFFMGLGVFYWGRSLYMKSKKDEGG